MATATVIDTSQHPLSDGYAPEWASEWGQDRFGVFIAFTLDDVTQRLRWIRPGRFQMGSPEDEPGRWGAEGPRHLVTLPQGFWLFDTPCTQALWEAVMGENPSSFKSPDRPVEQVRWDDAQGFIERINARVPGLALSLPSESQWEHACRAGIETALYSGAIEIIGERNAPALDPIAWYGGNSGEGFELENGWDTSDWKGQQYPNKRAGTRPVRGKQANPWGLHDMLGNVHEWVQDAWHDNYEGAPSDGSAWESDETGAGRVFRGGSWSGLAGFCRSAYRGRAQPGIRYYSLGFRCARVQES